MGLKDVLKIPFRSGNYILVGIDEESLAIWWDEAHTADEAKIAAQPKSGYRLRVADELQIMDHFFGSHSGESLWI